MNGKQCKIKHHKAGHCFMTRDSSWLEGLECMDKHLLLLVVLWGLPTWGLFILTS